MFVCLSPAPGSNVSDLAIWWTLVWTLVHYSIAYSSQLLSPLYDDYGDLTPVHLLLTPFLGCFSLIFLQLVAFYHCWKCLSDLAPTQTLIQVGGVIESQNGLLAYRHLQAHFQSFPCTSPFSCTPTNQHCPTHDFWTFFLFFVGFFCKGDFKATSKLQTSLPNADEPLLRLCGQVFNEIQRKCLPTTGQKLYHWLLLQKCNILWCKGIYALWPIDRLVCTV